MQLQMGRLRGPQIGPISPAGVVAVRPIFYKENGSESSKNNRLLNIGIII